VEAAIRAGAQLLILLPNFLGLNGKVQQWFDKAQLKRPQLKVDGDPPAEKDHAVDRAAGDVGGLHRQTDGCGSSPSLKTKAKGGG